MPDALELLKTRRSLKPFEMTGPGPSPAELDTILTIGARVPDHGKLAPWRFIVFEGEGRTRAGEIFARLFAQRTRRPPPTRREGAQEIPDAPLVIAVVSKTVEHFKVPAWEQELSAGASAMNIVHGRDALRLCLRLGHRLDRVRPRRARCARPCCQREDRGLYPHRQADKTIEDRPRRRCRRSSRGSEADGAVKRAMTSISPSTPLVTLERPLEHLALVLGDDAVLAFRQHHARERAVVFLDHVAAGVITDHAVLASASPPLLRRASA